MKFKVASGLQITTSTWGSQNDPLVILLHGGGQTRHAWGLTGKKLSQSDFYVIALDLRGHGDSDWDKGGDYSIDAFKGDLASIILQVGKPASLVGASLGGMASLSLAGDSETKSLCSALVMVDIGLYPNAEGSDQVLEFMSSGKEGFRNLEEAALAISGYLPHRERPTDISGLEKNLRLKKDGRYYWHWDPKFIEGRFNSKTSNYKDKQVELAKGVSVPTLLIKGALSNVLTQEEVETFLKIIPHSQFIEIKEAAHMIAGDRNDIFAESAIKFLKDSRL
jgi:pimeloyl-ACP methyl ester carboxylesterase